MPYSIEIQLFVLEGASHTSVTLSQFCIVCFRGGESVCMGECVNVGECVGVSVWGVSVNIGEYVGV